MGAKTAEVADKVAEKGSNLIGKAFNGVTGIFKDAAAANEAHRINEEAKEVADAKLGKTHGAIGRAVETIGDMGWDGANILTGGVARRVGNMFDDKDSKIDYGNLKDAKKSGHIDAKSKTSERTVPLLNDAVNNTDYSKGL